MNNPADIEKDLKIGDTVVIMVTGETCERLAEVVWVDECKLFYKHPRLKLLDAPEWVRLTLKFGDYIILRRVD